MVHLSTAVLVYVLGRITKPEDRSKVFIAGLLVFFIGTLFNGILFSVTGVIIFVLCKVIFQPLFDLPYYPIMMQTIDAVVKIEKRNEYTYILSHEFGLFLGRAFGLILFMVLAFVSITGFCIEVCIDPGGSFAVDCLSISPEHHQTGIKLFVQYFKIVKSSLQTD